MNAATPIVQSHAMARQERTFLVLIFAYSFVPVIGGLVRLVELAGGPTLMPDNPRVIADPLPVVIHIVGNFAYCFIGATQFLPSLRRQNPERHRRLGYTVVLAGLASAASGIYMTHAYAFPAGLQGELLYGFRLFIGSAMLTLITWGVVAARSGRFRDHAAAMVRAYAIAQGASTQGFLGMTWMIATGEEAVGLTRDILMIFAWVLNLAVAELIIRRGVYQARPHPSGDR